MEAFSQGWMCPCEMKLLLRKRDCKRFCRIRLHFQISLLNGIDAQVGQPAAAAVWAPSLQASVTFSHSVGTGSSVPERGLRPHTQQRKCLGMTIWVICILLLACVGCSFIPWEMNNIFFACLVLGYTWWCSGITCGSVFRILS